MKEKREYRMVLTILLIWLILLAGIFRPSGMAQFPKPSVQNLLNGVWALELEDYLREHISFHDGLFRLKSHVDLLLGEKQIQGVYVTSERLLEKPPLPVSSVTAAPVNEFYERTGLPTCLVLVPSAAGIYETSLPVSAVGEKQSDHIQQIYSEMHSGIRCVDAYNVLYSLRDDYIYYRTDTHWTSYGAYYVYQAAIQKMGFTPVPYQNYVISHISTSFRGDLYERTLYNGVKPDVLDVYTLEGGAEITGVTAYYRDGSVQERGTQLHDEQMLDGKARYDFYLGNPCEALLIRTNLENGKKLLLWGDDYADCMVPFLLQHYSEICVMDLEQLDKSRLREEDFSEYTQVLFLCGANRWEALWDEVEKSDGESE